MFLKLFRLDSLVIFKAIMDSIKELFNPENKLQNLMPQVLWIKLLKIFATLDNLQYYLDETISANHIEEIFGVLLTA